MGAGVPLRITLRASVNLIHNLFLPFFFFKIVICYLERQYRGIATKAKDIVRFVKPLRITRLSVTFDLLPNANRQRSLAQCSIIRKRRLIIETCP